MITSETVLTPNDVDWAYGEAFFPSLGLYTEGIHPTHRSCLGCVSQADFGVSFEEGVAVFGRNGRGVAPVWWTRFFWGEKGLLDAKSCVAPLLSSNLELLLYPPLGGVYSEGIRLTHRPWSGCLS